ncbi:MAG: DNA mismatch repair endonuclease MutL [Deltaproteobacteria bacterium]|nr:DNA mismatch repair endonuclease MutL [Deltaproteobacteria bacterium]
MIRLLDDDVINRIAAGEVVERPASVLKELVENALDAGARHLAVALRGGGTELVQVADDGSGMDRSDATLCLERHATSKIMRFEDLDEVGTLGFRGEAVPSIAAVSRFELLTRLRGADSGTRVRVEGGKLVDVAEAGAPEGTRISVRDLFFNVPARRKFLRTEPTELGHCEEALRRILLIRPEISAELLVDGRARLRAPLAADRLERAAALLGPPGAQLVAVQEQRGDYEIDALLSPLEHSAAANQAQLYLYVNGRFVRDGLLRKAVTEAYQALLPRGRAPLVVLELRLPAEEVDVNVHPAKIEVRFREARHVIERVASSLHAGLSRLGHRVRLPSPGAPWASAVEAGNQLRLGLPTAGEGLSAISAAILSGPQGSQSDPQQRASRAQSEVVSAQRTETRAQPTETGGLISLSEAEEGNSSPSTLRSVPQHVDIIAQRADGGPRYSVQASQRTESDTQHSAVRRAPPVIDPRPAWSRAWASPPRPAALVSAAAPAPAPAPSGSGRYQDLRLIGQALGRFVLAEAPEGLLLIDQQALSLALVRAQLEPPSASPGRALLSPRVVELDPAALHRFAALAPALAALGVVAEDFGPSALILKQLPLALSAADPDALLPALLRGPSLPGEPGGPGLRAALIERLSALAVPAEQQRSLYELRELLKRVDAVLAVPPLEDTARCRLLTAAELERLVRGGRP